METLKQFLFEPWPWYVAGPLIGLMVPGMLLMRNKVLGVSSSLRHACAACAPANIPFFTYDWRSESWNLLFVLGIALGGVLAALFLNGLTNVALNPQTQADLGTIGITNFDGLIPMDWFGPQRFWSVGLPIGIVGGFLVGFGARWAGGCTSGHAISGIANLQWPSVVATVGFFAGGLLMTHLLLPLVF
jgi:uncharacterized membrane protein YedE/YeeE